MTALERWAVFFRYAADKGKRELINEIIKTEEGIAMASEGLIAFSKDETERARLLSEYKFAVDYQSDMVESRRAGLAEGEAKGKAEGFAEGKEEGLAEGEAKGEAKGRKEGLAEGEAKGEAKALAAVRQSMERLGMSAENIAKVTGLSADEATQYYRHE